MDTTALVRDASKVHAALKELPDGSVVALEPVKIYSPHKYLEKNLVTVGMETYILGIYGITVKDKYLGVSLINAMIQIEPTNTNKIKINGEDYFEFVFDAGAVVFKSTTLVRIDTLVYRIYDEFISKGSIPWYMSYEDLGHIFDSAKKFANANIGSNPEVTQLIASIIVKDPNNRSKYYRTAVKTQEDLKNIPPLFVPLKSVSYSATNTTSKLSGAYFNEGVTSALLNPSDRVERIESLLRK